MKEQRGIIRQKLITSLVLVALILSSYGTFLSEAVAAAINYENQKIATSDKKVSFDAYFANGDTKTHNVIADTKDENELTLDIKLEEGVMQNTKITFNYPNFQIDFEKLKENQLVKNVNEAENSIELNQIMENTTIPVTIRYKNEDEISIDDFSKNTDILLTATYTSSDDTDKEINGSISLNVGWTSTIEGKLESSISNYSEISGKSVLIANYKSTMNNTTLPMEYTNLEINVPEVKGEIPAEVKVIENGKELSEDQYIYDSENKRVNIAKTNSINEENKVSSITGNLDYTVIYTYNKEFKLDKVNTTLESNLRLKAYTLDEVILSNSQELEKEKNNVTTNLKINTDSKISKGYLYNSNYEMPYKVNLSAQIQFIIPGSDIEFVENGETFLGDNVKLNASAITEYKNTTINKEELNTILGEKGTLSIINANTNEVIAKLNSESKADDNGNITIKYDGVNRIRILIQNAEQIGTININSNKKIIKNRNISTDTLKAINKYRISFDNKNIAVTDTVNKDIDLYDTVTKSTMEVSKTEFSTLDDNVNMNIKLNLLTNSMDYDLYQNPRLSLTFPSEFENITINSVGISFENGLSIANKRVTTNSDGTKTLYIDLSGNQQTYLANNDITANPQIVVDANVKINRTTTTREVDLTYNYSNEKAIKYEDEGKQVAKIKITAPYGLIMSTNVDGTEGNTKEIPEHEIQARSQEQVVHVEENIVNNYSSDVNNFEITGVIPLKDKQYTLGDNTIESNYSANITGNIEINRNDATIEFSEDNENWSTTRTENTDLFRIKFKNSTLKQGDLITLSYNLKIPENVSYSKDGYVAFITAGQNENVNVNAWSGAKLSTEDAVMGETTPEVSTVEDGEIKTEISVMQGNQSLEEGQVVYDEQNLKYIIKLTNTTNSTINNIKVTAKNTNAVFWEFQKIKLDDWQSDWSYQENTEKTEQEFTIEKLDPGESTEVNYQVVVKKDGESTTQATVNISADNIESKELKSIENQIIDGKIGLTIDNGITIGYPDLSESQKVFMNLNITNLTEDVIKNAKVSIYYGDIIVDDTETETTSEVQDFTNNVENKVLTLVIPELNPGEEYLIAIAGELPEQEEAEKSFYVYATVDTSSEIYISGQLDYTSRKTISDIEMIQTANIENVIKNEDNLIYTTKITNTGDIDYSVSISDKIPSIAAVNKIYYVQNNQENEISADSNNTFTFTTRLNAGETITLVIDTTINEFISSETEIENKVSATSVNFNEEKYSNTIKHTLDSVLGPTEPEEPENPEEPTNPEDPDNPSEPEDPDNPNNPDDPNNPENPDNPTTPSEKDSYSISGKVWLDEDKDGVKDDNEGAVAGVKLRLLNSNGVELKNATSTSNGTYTFSNVENGSYRILLEYDKETYGLSTYQKDGVSSSKDSDFIKSNVLENGEQKEVAATETINVSNSDITNIDAGLIRYGKHELVITKTLGEVTVETNKSTKTYDLRGKQIGKVEIASKQMPNAEITVEYIINIQNNGDMDEFITNIRDIPSEGELADKAGNWSIEGEALVNSELSNNPIKAGETKQITLKLKTTVDSDGTAKTVNNKVDITENTNEDNVTNINTDKASAQLLIGIKTGGIFIVGGIAVIIILLIVLGYILIKKRKGEGIAWIIKRK